MLDNESVASSSVSQKFFYLFFLKNYFLLFSILRDWKSFFRCHRDSNKLSLLSVVNSAYRSLLVSSSWTLHDTVQSDFWHRAQVQFERENISLINLITNISFLLRRWKKFFLFWFFLSPASSSLMTQRPARGIQKPLENVHNSSFRVNLLGRARLITDCFIIVFETLTGIGSRILSHTRGDCLISAIFISRLIFDNSNECTTKVKQALFLTKCFIDRNCSPRAKLAVCSSREIYWK